MNLEGHPKVLNRSMNTRKTSKPDIIETKGITLQDDAINKRKNNFKKYRRRFFKGQNLWWWNPPVYSTPAQFCADTSIHGLKFMAQRNRHISERIFWLIAFGVGIAAAAVLINSVWTRYQANPVIVTFMPTDQDIKTLPFPAITICNMNKFPKSKIEELLLRNNASKTNGSVTHLLKYADNICNIQRSFSKLFNYSHTRGSIDNKNNTISIEDRKTLVTFVFNQTLQCDELLRLCMWGNQHINCAELFKSSTTNYGRCCTFNGLPNPLLFRGDRSAVRGRWTDDEINEWRKLKFADKWVLMGEELKFPRRQTRAGMPYGLSVLIDPQIHEYFCPISDSEGLKYLVHNPLEVAHVHQFGSVVGVGREVFIEIQPDVTLADEEIDDYPAEKRLCIFGNERELKAFIPYTVNNCIDECMAKFFSDKCGCAKIFHPVVPGVKRLCTEDDFECLKKTESEIIKNIWVLCPLCEALCEDVKYNYDTTWAHLQNSSDLWRSYKNGSIASWADHEMSVIHFYYGAQTVVPKCRKKLFGAVDLIANVGGILGLCLGISILSAVEAVYYITIRIFWQRIRRMTLGYRVANIFWLAYNKYKLQQSLKTKKYTYGADKMREKISFIDLEGPHSVNVKLPSVYGDGYDKNKRSSLLQKQHNC